MNQEKILGIVRHLLNTIGGFLLAFGAADENIIQSLSTGAEMVIGGVLVLIPVIGSILNKNKAKKREEEALMKTPPTI